jgi:sialate O-acetylesterase
MKIQGDTTITLKDILVGEVWICSGQSNMEFPLGSTRTAEGEVPKARHPQLRLFTLPRACSLEPLSDAEAGWETCTPDTARHFSAVGYFFGRKIHRTLNVPVGLIECSWGGTQAEEWTDLESLKSVPEFGPILERWENAPQEIRDLLKGPRPVELWFDQIQLLSDGPANETIADFDNGSLRTTYGGVWDETDVDPTGAYAVRVRRPGHDGSEGAAVIQGQIEVSHWPMFRIEFAPENRPLDMSGFRGLKFYTRGEGLFKVHFLQPSISDWDNYATSTFQATPEWASVSVLFQDLRQAGWGKKLPFTPDELTGLVIAVQPSLKAVIRPPAGLFNGMIMPVVPYSIQGAIWYQGEGNAGRAYQYRKLLPTLIRSWRRNWNQGDFPFIVVQLPNFKQQMPQPGESNWAELREAQFMSLSCPNTGLAVSIDVGEADDVHPRNKTEIGNRLGAWALGTTYGQKIVYSGPLFESVKFNGSKATVSFKHTGGGLVAKDGNQLEGFALAGPDRVFHWAQARIVGDRVELYSEQIDEPVAVRYAWADNPKCNLYNKEGFPAAPFRSDQWPGLTVDKY